MVDMYLLLSLFNWSTYIVFSYVGWCFSTVDDEGMLITNPGEEQRTDIDRIISRDAGLLHFIRASVLIYNVGTSNKIL